MQGRLCRRAPLVSPRLRLLTPCCFTPCFLTSPWLLPPLPSPPFQAGNGLTFKWDGKDGSFKTKEEAQAAFLKVLATVRS